MATVTSTVQPYPVTDQHRSVQDQIDRLKNTPHSEIVKQTRWGQDLKAKHVPTFADSVFAGNLDPAYKYFSEGFGEPYHAYQAKSHVLCVLHALPTLPANIAKFAYHLLTICSKHSRDMLSRDVKNLTNATLFITFGTIMGMGNGILTVLVDPLVFLYRFIVYKCTDKGQNSALLVIDVQNDFLPETTLTVNGQQYKIPKGSLAVNDAWATIPVINKLMSVFKGRTYFSKDWHRRIHGSFAKVLGVNEFTETTLNGIFQMGWPIHCVQNSFGSEFAHSLDTSRIRPRDIIYKGTQEHVDSYSAFFDNDKKSQTKLARILKAHHITDVFVTGLAYDYCVGYTALDAKKLGFRTYVIEDATRGVNAPDKTGRLTNDVMREKLLKEGIKIVQSSDLIGKHHAFTAAPAA